MRSGAAVGWCASIVVAASLCAPISLAAQSAQTLEGTWSTPPLTPKDYFCASFCTDAGLQRLEALLADPANDSRSYAQLAAEATAYQNEYLRSFLTAAALMTFPLSLENDPGYVRCQPWGIAREVFSQLGLQIRRLGKERLEMRYGEWNGRRIIDLDPTPAPSGAHTRMGHSVGHFDGETLVIETSAIAQDSTYWRSEHSDQLKIVERYTRIGDRLFLTATFDDPWSLRTPLELKKVWKWAPSTRLMPVACERPVLGKATSR